MKPPCRSAGSSFWSDSPGEGTFQSATTVISCVKSSLLFLHSSGCISYHLRGCCSSTGRGRNQLLLDAWAESCRAFSACLSLSCGNRLDPRRPRPGIDITAAVGSHILEIQYIQKLAEIIPGTSTPPVSRNVLIF